MGELLQDQDLPQGSARDSLVAILYLDPLNSEFLLLLDISRKIDNPISTLSQNVAEDVPLVYDLGGHFSMLRIHYK